MIATAEIILEEIHKGSKIEKIMDIYKVSRDYINRIIRNNNILSIIDDEILFGPNVYKEIYRKYNTGINLNKIAEIYNLEELVVKHIVSRKGIRIRFNPITHSKVIVLLRDTNFSFSEIASKVGCVASNVKTINDVYKIRSTSKRFA